MTTTTSSKPRKQRLAIMTAPLHKKRKWVAAHLSGELIIRYNRRSVPVVVGDRVKVLRGSYKGHADKVIGIDSGSRRIVVEGVTVLKADGTKKPRPIDPSNVVITNLNLSDAKRRDRLAATIKATGAEKEKLLKEMEAEGVSDRKELEEDRRRAEEERAKAEAEAEHEHGEEEDEEEPAPGGRESAPGAPVEREQAPAGEKADAAPPAPAPKAPKVKEPMAEAVTPAEARAPKAPVEDTPPPKGGKTAAAGPTEAKKKTTRKDQPEEES